MNDDVEPIDVGYFAALLEERREEIRSLEAQLAEAAATVELDQQRVGRLSRMDAMQVQAMAEETVRRRQLEGRRIEAALARIDSGDYGHCLSCDDIIPTARLAIDPSVTLCVGCASKKQG